MERLLTDLARCIWCRKPFRAKVIGAHPKKFCSSTCKDRFHTALRQWAQEAMAAGQLSVSDLKTAQASCTTRRETD